MITQRELETRLRADAEELDRDFPRADKLELRVLARVAVTPRERRRRVTLKQELALAGLVVVTVALLAIGIGRLRSLTQPIPARPTPSPVVTPGAAAAQFPPGTVKMITATIGWAHTSHFDDVFRTSDGGQHWDRVTPPASANETQGGAVATYFLDADHAWVARFLSSPPYCCKAPPTRLILLRTADGGKTWTSGGQFPASGATWFSVGAQLSVLDHQHGWLFVEVQTHFQPTSPLNGPEITNWDRGLTRTIYTTSDGGLHWTRLVSAPQSGGTVLGTAAVGCATTGLTFVSIDTGWLTFGACPPPFGTAGSLVITTHDGGRTWASVSVGSGICDAAPPLVRQNAGVLIVTCGTGPTVYTTADGGRTWSSHAPPNPGPFPVINFVDEKTGWFASGTGDVYRTTNSARTWTRVGHLPLPTHQVLAGLQFLDSKVGFATTRIQMGPFTYFETRDGGRTWEEVAAPVASQ